MDNFMTGLEFIIRVAVLLALLVLLPVWGPFWLLGRYLNEPQETQP